MDVLKNFEASLINNSKHTRINYISNLTALKKRYGDLLNISGAELREYFREMSTKVKPSTVNTKITSIRAFYRWAKVEKIINEDPAEGNLRMLENPAVGEITYVTPRQVDYILSVARENIRDYAVFRLMLDTAARANELVSVRVCEFREALKEIKIILHGKGVNGGKNEYVSFGGNIKTVRAIKEYLKNRKTDSEYLFPNKVGDRMSTRSLQNIVKKYMLLANAKWNNKCNIPNDVMHPHTLRHTAIKNFWNITKDPKATMDFARHRSFNTTLRYINGTDFGGQVKEINKLPWNEL